MTTAGLGFGLAGCTTLPGSEPLRVNVVDVTKIPGEGMELRMAVKLRLQNPNDTAIDYHGVSLTLDVRGSTFASGVSAEEGSVPGFGERVLTVPVSVGALAAVRQVIGFVTAEQPKVDFVLRGRLGGTAFGGHGFETKGELDLSALGAHRTPPAPSPPAPQ